MTAHTLAASSCLLTLLSFPAVRARFRAKDGTRGKQRARRRCTCQGKTGLLWCLPGERQDDREGHDELPASRGHDHPGTRGRRLYRHLRPPNRASDAAGSQRTGASGRKRRWRGEGSGARGHSDDPDRLGHRARRGQPVRLRPQALRPAPRIRVQGAASARRIHSDRD